MKRILKSVLETQQTRARKEFKALERVEKKGIPDSELIQEMTKDMKNPESAESIMQAAAAVLYMRGVKNGDTPITDAANRCLTRKKESEKAGSVTTQGDPLPNT